MLLTLAISIALQFSVFMFGLAVFGLVSIYIFSAKLSLYGCWTLFFLSSLFWIWACWRSEEPAMRTFVTLLIHSSIYFLFVAGVSLLGFMARHTADVGIGHFLGLVITAFLFWRLCVIANRRNSEAEPFGPANAEKLHR